jgi:hypothetical protein
MFRIMTLRSKKECIYDGGPIILQYNIIILTSVLQLPTVFSNVTCSTDLWSSSNRLCCITLYYIIILTTVLKLPTVFSTVTCCKGLWFRSNRLYCITLYYNTYHCVTITYSIQYSNMLYRFVV